MVCEYWFTLFSRRQRKQEDRNDTGGIMKHGWKAALMLAGALLVIDAFGEEGTLSGHWTATLKRGDRTGTATMNVVVSRNQVTGALSEPSGQTLQIENGKIEGAQLTFDVWARERGGTKPIHFFGQVADDVITLNNESRGKRGQSMRFHRVKE